MAVRRTSGMACVIWGAFLAGALPGCNGGGGGGGAASEAEIAETKKRAEAVIAALGNYQKAKSRYPATLEELPADVRGKFQSPTVWDKVWRYKVSPDGVYILSVAKSPGGSPVMAYNGESKAWSMN
jgi:hypothetical protein